MEKIGHRILLRAVQIMNILLVTAAFGLSWKAYYATNLPTAPGLFQLVAVIVGFAAVYMVFTQIYDAFLVSQMRISEIIYSQMLSALLADLFLYFVIALLMTRLPNVLPALGTLVLQLVVIVIWSFFTHLWYFAVFPAKRSAIVHDGEREFEKLIHEYGLEKKFRIQAILQVDECLADLHQLAELEAVFLTDLHSAERNTILKYCVAEGISVYVIPSVGDAIMSSAAKVHMFHLPMLRVNRYSPSPEYLLFKRLFDILFAGVSLLVASPVMLVTACAVKLYDGGPVFYRQTRLTRDGKRFSLLKFRSMRVDAEANGVARLSTGDHDPRITPVGRFIRKCRIDELPQLLNILEGSMAIVGPRPERPEIAEQYEAFLPEFCLRLQAKAGLTGYAQVYGKYNSTPYDKLQMDLMYIANPSLIEDLRICFATIKILFMPESTEGIEVGTVTAMNMNYDAEMIEH